MVNDVIITISPLTLDQEHSPGELCIIAASMAIMQGGIPFTGPVGAVRIGYVDGEFVVHMTESQAENATMDLHVAGTATQINMLECGANEAPIEVLKE